MDVMKSKSSPSYLYIGRILSRNEGKRFYLLLYSMALGTILLSPVNITYRVCLPLENLYNCPWHL